MATSSQPVFESAVDRVLGSWTVLQLAVQHGFGGQDSQAKAAWMPGAISQWFSENNDIEVGELEDFLAEILDNEFDTVADDGSLPEITRTICGYWRLCSSGLEATLLQEIQRLPKPDVSGSRCQAVEAEEVEEEDEESIPAPNQSYVTETSQREEIPMEEDDGWTVVRKPKNK